VQRIRRQNCLENFTSIYPRSFELDDRYPDRIAVKNSDQLTVEEFPKSQAADIFPTIWNLPGSSLWIDICVSLIRDCENQPDSESLDGRNLATAAAVSQLARAHLTVRGCHGSGQSELLSPIVFISGQGVPINEHS
jgi:hypothetical protein